MDNTQAPTSRYAAGIPANTQAPAVVDGDTFSGQIAHMDGLIDGARTILTRLTMSADKLAPVEPSPEGANMGNKIAGRIDASPETGPLLFRMQNRNASLHALQDDIFRQLNRLDRVL